MGRTLRIVALLIVACSVGAVGAPSEAQTTRTLTATPSTDLADGEVVELQGTGFTPFATVYFCQGVDDGTPGPDDCGGPIQSVPTDAFGGFVATYTVQRFMSPGGVPIDCAQPSANCAIGASDFFAQTPGFAFAAITFTPLPPRTLTVTPDTGLDDGDVVTVHGTGFTPSAPAYFCQTFTFAGPDDCGAPVQSVQSDAAGEFVATYTVQRFISPGGVPTDCALTGSCVMGASDTFAGPGRPFAPLNFTLQPPQAITVTPDTDLDDGEAVTVHGVSFFPGGTVSLCQGADGLCRGPTQTVEVDAAGDFSVTYTVQRFLTTSGLTRTDCAAASASCSITYAASTGSGLAPITFAPQPPLPQISGTVTDAQGTPAPGVDVWAYTPSDTWVGSLQAVTDAQGAFAFAQVEPGVAYRILFRPPAGSPLGSEWWDERPGRRLANVVALSAAELTEVHAQLEEAGRISGSVTDPDGNPVPGAAVRVYGPGDTLIASHVTATASDGTYQIGNLRPAESGVDYRVQVSPPAGSGLAAEWFDDAARRTLATAVAVPGGQTVAGIDAELEQAGAITGSVTDTDGNPVSGVQVSALVPGDVLIGSYTASSASDGTYRLGNVRPADYRVRFSPPIGSGLVQEWFDGAASRDQATDVTVSPGQTAAGIDAQLANPP